MSKIIQDRIDANRAYQEWISNKLHKLKEEIAELEEYRQKLIDAGLWEGE